MRTCHIWKGVTDTVATALTQRGVAGSAADLDTAAALVSRARAAVAEGDKLVKLLSSASWKKWLSEIWSSNLRKVYDFSKTPSQWLPDPSPGEVLSHDAVGRTEFEHAKYRRLWNAQDTRAPGLPSAECSESPDMPPLDAATLRAASLAFSPKTSQTFDGIHPRHFSFLSDDAVNCLGMLFTACEKFG